MLFNSLDFLFFFVFIFILYWTIPDKFKWIILLLSSYFFYAYWNPIYLILLLFSTSVDYFFSLYLTSSEDKKKRKLGLGLSLFLNFGLLFTFKYYNFFVDCFNELFNTFLSLNVNLPNYSIILPIGISFYTFQAVSYAIDVYRKDIKAERKFGRFALYIAFFPQLVAGPIERAKELLPQVNELKKFISTESFTNGIKTILWGLFLKVVVADNLAVLVDAKFNHVESQSGGGLFFALFLFAFQLYSDFNGYSKMALGLAELLGYKLMNNFNYPYISSSFNEFWKRWHISLSQWVRDYIFFPLGGTRGSILKILRNIFIAFFLMGLWHGATVNYVLWGIISGFLLMFEYLINKFLFRVTNPFWKNLKLLKIGLVFSLFCLSIVPIRSLTFHESLIVYEKLFSSKFADNRYSPGMLGLYILIFVEIWFGLKINAKFNIKNTITSYMFYLVIFFMILILGRDTGAQFIYFQF
jgi:D-alanyl-lipoteichoic acid acyltransferase DltB (MBOAT superfamily)